jgi:ribosome maturation factor RimP
VDGDHITVLDTKVVTDYSIDAGTAVINIVLSKNNEDGVLALLASDKNCVTTEQLERVHRGL